MARPCAVSDTLPLQTLEPLSTTCLTCGKAAHIAYHTQRTVTTLTGRHRLHLAVRRCAPRYHRPYRPEAEGAWALPHGEYGLDVIALAGLLRYQHHQSLAEIHQSLHERGLLIGERTVLNLLARYEELVTLHMTDRERLQPLVQKQGSLILAVDGLKPDVGHEVLRVVRDCISGELLLVWPLLSEREADLVTLLKEVQEMFSVPIRGSFQTVKNRFGMLLLQHSLIFRTSFLFLPAANPLSLNAHTYWPSFLCSSGFWFRVLGELLYWNYQELMNISHAILGQRGRA
ncbi:hypothetical protein KSZ_21390 [Dictyobacter formicarum]|uniref:Uncharacterized protein n=1 Tax=Dictyobacter formicarum TaxID=2778368 RepID=A0ABQ3VE81_9CHLR|nr:hypothetical protein KSZ_21390 [Dictyobacter formicarum]